MESGFEYAFYASGAAILALVGVIKHLMSRMKSSAIEIPTNGKRAEMERQLAVLDADVKNYQVTTDRWLDRLEHKLCKLQDEHDAVKTSIVKFEEHIKSGDH